MQEISIFSSPFDSDVSFIGLARQKVRWTFCEQNAPQSFKKGAKHEMRRALMGLTGKANLRRKRSSNSSNRDKPVHQTRLLAS